MKPPIPYFGGKTALAAKIAALLPEHRSYIEPFGGSLAVLLAKPVEPMEVVNDLDGDLMNFWRVLRDRPDELVWAAETTPHSRAEFNAATDFDHPDELERARRVWVVLCQGRSGRMEKTGWRTNTTPNNIPTLALPRYMQRYRERLLPVAQRLQNVTLESRDAMEIIREYGKPGALIYADPPYLASTRKSGAVYRHEMSNSHETLLEALRETPAGVVLSGYDSEEYDLPGWEQHRFDAKTQRESRTEVVWVKRGD